MVTFIRTGLDLVDRALTVVVNAVKALEANPLNQGVLLEGVPVATTDTRINHGLSRVPRGYLVMKASAPVFVGDGSASTNPTLYINVKASSAATVSLLVF